MLIVFNPTAGAGRHRRLSRAVASLHRHGLRPELVQTRRAGDATAIAREAAQRGVALIVAAGGDGTIAEVAAGLAGSAATLGILPLGTANVLALEIGLPVAPEPAAAVIAAGRSALLHPGVARFGDGSARLFVQMVGAGFDAAVVAHLDLRLKRLIGRGAYVWQSLCDLPRYGFAPISVEIDGVTTGAASVIVSKGRLYAGRHLVAPGAAPFAPGFQVVLFRRGGPWQALRAGAALPLDLVPRLPEVEIVPARRVRLAGGAPVQADGDAAGVLPVEIGDAAPLRVLAP